MFLRQSAELGRLSGHPLAHSQSGGNLTDTLDYRFGRCRDAKPPPRPRVRRVRSIVTDHKVLRLRAERPSTRSDGSYGLYLRTHRHIKPPYWPRVKLLPFGFTIWTREKSRILARHNH